MVQRIILIGVALVVFGGGQRNCAFAGPPVSGSSQGWLQAPDVSNWKPTLPQLEMPSFALPELPGMQHDSMIVAAPRRAWNVVSSGVQKSWQWSKTNLNPFSSNRSRRAKRDGPSLWERLMQPAPEQEVDSVVDFLGQPRPY